MSLKGAFTIGRVRFSVGKDSLSQEYVVRVFEGTRPNRDRYYFTDNRDDAYSTAREMIHEECERQLTLAFPRIAELKKKNQ